MARRRTDIDMNYDSMMDTLTNVVGFLILVLMLVQMGLGDAVERIRAIDPLAFGLREDDLERAKIDADSRWAAAADLAAQAEQADQQAKQDRQELDRLKTRPDENVQVAKVDLAEARKRLDTAARKAQEAEKALAALLAQRSQLKGQLDQTPAVEAPPTKIVKLPNPRQAPKNAKEAVFLCRQGKVYSLDNEGLLDWAQRRTAYLQRQNRNKPNEVDGQKLVEFFDKEPVQDATFRLRIRVVNFLPYVVFERRPKAGETVAQIQQSGSLFQKALRLANLKNRYARFIVWNDSFDAYLEARKISDQLEVPAGWEPTTMTEEWYAYLGNNVQCVGRPKPPPAAPPKPGEKPPPPTRPPLPSEPID